MTRKRFDMATLKTAALNSRITSDGYIDQLIFTSLMGYEAERRYRNADKKDSAIMGRILACRKYIEEARKFVAVGTLPQLQQARHGDSSPGPKSLCMCGHTGDTALGYGLTSQHAGAVGHGRCIVPGCGCLKFTWSKYIIKGVR